jgi:hypothetical protein
VASVVRAHWPFVIFLTAGLILRVLAEVAYRPALLYIDSAKYLVGSGGSAPEGYQVLLRLLDPLGGLGLVTAAQHAFGLAMATALSDAYEFSWRYYQLPAVVMVPVAGALGFTALAARVKHARARTSHAQASTSHAQASTSHAQARAGASLAPAARAGTERLSAARTATAGRGRRTRPASAGSGPRAPAAR